MDEMVISSLILCKSDAPFDATKSAPTGGADFKIHDSIFRTVTDGGWLGRSIGLSVPPPFPWAGRPTL